MCNTKDADNNTDQNLDKSPEKNDNQKDTDSNKDQNLDKTPMNNDNQKVSDKFFKYVLILIVVFAVCQVVNCIFAILRQNTICNILSKSESSTISQTLDTTCYIGFLPIDSNLVNKLDTSLLSKIKCTQNSIDQDNQYIHRDEIKIIENVEELLHLEFAKIQEERNALTLWIGIITVVFLIFSFYSMLKSDDLVRQSRENLDEIKETSKECEKQFTDLDTKVEEKIKEYETKFDTLKKDVQNEINELEKNCQDKINQITDDVLKWLDNISSENQESIGCHSSENHCEEDYENYQLLKNNEEVPNSTTQDNSKIEKTEENE